MHRETDDKTEVITINVGGHLFETSRDTLCKGDSMLSKMFSGKFGYTFDKENRPFIDRDGNQRTTEKLMLRHPFPIHFKLFTNWKVCTTFRSYTSSRITQ